ncbi:uncharacterized protein LOC131949337 [Physella acuta]|uniref:uncharacterized protein LOC131949337 n=1 Tax=Physella acuta TaxID=109671 RepID=UPI0027DB0714|nr:uncharacterized protein LOC131949337 [Physella acuta]
MDFEEKEILTLNRVELVENINILDGLYTQLIARKVLTQRAVNRIKSNGRHAPEDQVEELLNTIVRLNCYQLFCEALTADHQGHIVDMYLKKSKLEDQADPSTPGPSARKSDHTGEATKSKKLCTSTAPDAVVYVSGSGQGCLYHQCDHVTPGRRQRPHRQRNNSNQRSSCVKRSSGKIICS